MAKQSDSLEEFLKAAKNRSADSDLDKLLGRCKKEECIAWVDEDGLDAMHHSIASDNPEAVRLLFKRGHFLRPHEPSCFPYLHLACWLGRRAIVGLIVENRSEDDHLRFPLDAEGLTKRFGENRHYTKHHDRNKGDESERNELLPLDVASQCGYVGCVELLIDQCVTKRNPEYAKSGRIVLAVIADSPASVDMFLRKDPAAADVTKALEVSLHLARPDCLRQILTNDSHKITKLGKLNLFHVLYTHSSTSFFGADCFSRLPDMTSVLIKCGCSVKTHDIPNTYPMYSLLRNSLSYHGFKCVQYYLQCLKLLLKAGADPNFNEVRQEKVLNNKGVKTIAGRPAYATAVHCLLETVETHAQFLDSNELVAKFITQSTDLLVQYNAAVNKVGRVGNETSKLIGCVLHQYAKSSVKLGVDADILKFFLREGADPDIKVQGKYMVNVYFDILFKKLKLTRKFQTEFEPDVINTIEICKHMSKPSIRDALNIFLKDYKSPTDQIRQYVEKVKSEFTAHISSVTSLQRLCKHRIWTLCGRSARNCRKLPLKPQLRSYILPTVA
ncbi:hypothetical protein ScPMuIL_006483 [Solemya velum]